MAARKRRSPARKSTPARRRRRAPARSTSTRRRRRRRRNPKFDVMGTLLGAAGGAALGLGAFALSQQNFTPTTTMAAVIGGGLLLGAAASGWRKDVGAGIAGGAGAIAATYGASMLYTKQASSNTQTGRMGAVRQLPLAAGGSHAQMNAVQAPIGRRRKLVMSGMGAVEAPIAPGVKARLSGLA